MQCRRLSTKQQNTSGGVRSNYTYSPSLGGFHYSGFNLSGFHMYALVGECNVIALAQDDKTVVEE